MSLETNLTGHIGIFRHKKINGRAYDLCDGFIELAVGDIIADSENPFLLGDERLEVLKIEKHQEGITLIIRPFNENAFYLDEKGTTEYIIKKGKYSGTYLLGDEEKCFCLKLIQ